MSSDAEPKPAGEDSRRDLLQKLKAIAVAAPAAANAAPKAAGQQGAMPMVRLGPHSISRLVIGCNTLGNLSHLSRMIDVEMRAWNTPEQLLKDFQHALELGINCEEGGSPIIEKVNALGVGKMLWTARGQARMAGARTWQSPQEIAKKGPISIHHAGSIDILWRLGQLNKARDYCKMVRDTGLLVAVTSHRPEVFMEIESQGWDVDYYMTCLYKYGRPRAEWEEEFAFNPGMAPEGLFDTREGDSPYYGPAMSFVRGDPPKMFKVIKQTKKPCFVYKILASGRLCEKPEFVEAAFRDTFAQIKPSDVVVVGHWTKQQDQYAINAEYVRRYGSNTAT